jgi:lipid-binding SYLF domain-containing protein
MNRKASFYSISCDRSIFNLNHTMEELKMSTIRYLSVLLAALCLISSPVRADDLTDNFVRNIPDCGEVSAQISGLTSDLKTILTEKVPSALRQIAQAVAVAYVKKGGFLVAIESGNGMLIVRNSDGWSNPAFTILSSASFGWQAGLEAKTVVLVFTKRDAATKLLAGNLKLGAGLDLAVGPLAADVGTGKVFDKEVYSYSDGVGLFAGLSLKGSSVSLDPDYNEGLYGRSVNSGEIFSGLVTVKCPRTTIGLTEFLNQVTE